MLILCLTAVVTSTAADPAKLLAKLQKSAALLDEVGVMVFLHRAM
jgi:hypothetical protein